MRVADQDLYNVISSSMEERTTKKAITTRTGIVSLDSALGGGISSGVTEIYGEASVGKTTLLFQTIANAQRSGMLVALCPSEYLDIPYMHSLGVDLNALILLTGNYAEDVLSAALIFLKDHQSYPCLLALDSATSMRPENDTPGVWLNLMDMFLTHVNNTISTLSSVVMVNQIRMKPSISPNKFFAGVSDSTARKVAGQFCTRLELSRMSITESEYNLVINTVASSFGVPSSIVELPVTKGLGIDADLDLVRFAIKRGVLERSGNWYMLAGVKQSTLGIGEIASVKTLQEFDEVKQYVLDQVMKGL